MKGLFCFLILFISIIIILIYFNYNKERFSSIKYKNLIVVPYRNRPEQLTKFIKNSYKIINDNLPNTLFVIVEQEQGKAFNRGKLLNIGFKEYSKITEFVITHDIDIVPKKDTVKELYAQNKHKVLGIFTSSYNTLGGIVKFKSHIFRKINGFPNNYWGWGLEDKALQNRAEYHKIDIKKNILNGDSNRFKFFYFLKDKNDRVITNQKEKNDRVSLFNKLSDNEKEKQINEDGLSSLNYEIIKRNNIKPNLIHIITSV